MFAIAPDSVMAVSEPAVARNPGPSWGFRFLCICDRILPEFIFRPLRWIGTWVALAPREDNQSAVDGKPKTYTLDPGSRGRYVRVDVTDLWGPGDSGPRPYLFQLAELEVFSP